MAGRSQLCTVTQYKPSPSPSSEDHHQGQNLLNKTSHAVSTLTTTPNMHSFHLLSTLLTAAAGTFAQSNVIASQSYYSTSGCVQNQGPSNTNVTVTRGAVNTCLLISAVSQPAVTLPSIVSEKTFLVTNSSCQGKCSPILML